ncbi:MAG: immunity 17 family protein [Fusobacteriaceae bacterium]|jgi:hypothetical protein|nr:immunity 17 family protein [Fusobacteriaceae bacterium]
MNIDNLKEILNSFGPIKNCVVLFIFGVILICGYIFNWKWLYPSRRTVINYNPGIRRILVLITGIILIVCSIIFFIYRNKLNWN